MATGNITQTTAAKALSEQWPAEAEYAINNVRGLTNVIWDTKEQFMGPGFKVHIPIISTYPAAAYAGSVTYTNFTETEVAITPTVAYTAVQIQEDVLLTTFKPAPGLYAPAIAEGVAQKIDVDGLGLFAGFTSTDVGAAGGEEFAEATFLNGISSIISNGGDKVMPGELYGFYHPAKWDAIFSLGNFVAASVRGDGAAPAKTGVLGMAYGVNFIFTKNVATSTTLRNLILSKKSMILVRKNYPKLEMERTDLTTKMVGSLMYGIALMHQATGGMHRTTTT